MGPHTNILLLESNSSNSPYEGNKSHSWRFYEKLQANISFLKTKSQIQVTTRQLVLW